MHRQCGTVSLVHSQMLYIEALNRTYLKLASSIVATSSLIGPREPMSELRLGQPTDLNLELIVHLKCSVLRRSGLDRWE